MDCHKAGRIIKADCRLDAEYERHRAYIIHEDVLINDRVSWFIQLHSFLLATYGIVFSAAIATFFPQGHADPEAARVAIKLTVAAILAGVTLIGIFSAMSARWSIEAASKAKDNIHTRWQSWHVPEVRAQFPGMVGGGDLNVDRDGSRLHKFLPNAMIGMWICSLGVPVAIVCLAFGPPPAADPKPEASASLFTPPAPTAPRGR